MFTEFLSKPLRVQIGLTILVTVALHGAFLLMDWYVVSPIGFGGTRLFIIMTLLALPLLVTIVTMPILLAGLLFKRKRPAAARLLLCCTIYVLIGFPMIRMRTRVRMTGFRSLAERSVPLIDSINRFTAEEGRPPSSLGELVPEHLPNIPRTGMPAYPDFEYWSGADSTQWGGNPWVVYVKTPSGGLNFDKFLYFPLQNYPRSAYGGVLERVGQWAYLHE